MPFDKAELQQAEGRSGQETPEERLLDTVFGFTAYDKYFMWMKLASALAPDAVLGHQFAGLPTSALTTLAQTWITHHLPASEIEEISTLASAVIGDKGKATQWLSEPNVAMDNKAPIDLIGEKEGYERVKNLLLRIEYGVLA